MALIPSEYQQVITIGLTTLLIFGFYALFNLKSEISASEAINCRSFVPHKLTFILCYISYFWSVLIMYLESKVPNPTIEDFIISGVLAGVIFILITVAIRKLKNTYVLLNDNALDFKYGRKFKKVYYSDMTDAYVASGYIWVRLKETNKRGHPRQIMIPAIFKDTGVLVQNINTLAC